MFKSINKTALTLARRSAFHTSAAARAASVFNMPAMSPTMTEGGVVSWKLQPGQSFAAGDVLLEVETDKATIDVEAQDDGVMWEILVQEGAKEIPVGQPIALLAEPGDDLASLERPELGEANAAPKESASAPKEAPAAKSEPKSDAKSEPKSSASPKAGAKADAAQKLLPSVELLLHRHGISDSDAFSKIAASGPHGRILKGDVLAYIGEINAAANTKVAEFVNNRSHLDLSNIQLAEAPKKVPEAPQKPKPSNIIQIKVTCDLGEEVSPDKFRYAFERSVDSSIKQTYAERYPQYSRGPSAVATGADDLFDELLAPSVQTKRFTVSRIAYDFGRPQAATVDAFDELLGLSAPVAPAQASTSINVAVTVQIDNTVTDAREFVEQFKDKLILQIPSKHIIIE